MRYYSIMVDRKAIYCIALRNKQSAVGYYQSMFLALSFAGIHFNLATSKEPKQISEQKKNEVLDKLRNEGVN